MILVLFLLGLLCIGSFELFVVVNICFFSGYRIFWDFKLGIMCCFMGFEIMGVWRMVYWLLVRCMYIVSL